MFWARPMGHKTYAISEIVFCIYIQKYEMLTSCISAHVSVTFLRKFGEVDFELCSYVQFLGITLNWWRYDSSLGLLPINSLGQLGFTKVSLRQPTKEDASFARVVENIPIRILEPLPHHEKELPKLFRLLTPCHPPLLSGTERLHKGIC